MICIDMEKNETIIKVNFPIPVNGNNEHYFGSLAAIYDVFTPGQIGCKLETLWDYGIDVGKPKLTRTCLISKHQVHRKSHRNK